MMIVLVYELDRKKPRAYAICLDSQIEFRHDATALKPWIYSPASGWSQISCRFRVFESVGHGDDREGRAVTFVDDEVLRLDPHMAAVAQSFHLELDETVPNQSPPFFLLPDTANVPGARKARVRLLFNRLAALPDVKSDIHLSTDFDPTNFADECPEIPGFRERALSQPQASELALAKAEATAPHEGLWLPFEIGPIHGAMQLGQDRGDAVFDAMLHVDRNAETITSGSLLRRSVTWTTLLGKTGSADADIATVVDVFSAETL